ncbi:hypothetical protein [Leekyejoonella antrihumi]|uniref:Uncharacterized protein n=1 Tax=Leekyejoonella antrihumi TaxID=1660198 RepID=A0A563E0K9_9MICO|nr:hypothetical protein [Leekyejoonella antrihumi]TWP35925.1 hypothetical protein FGL98_11875 [Leekyejoonella antrihumi]
MSDITNLELTIVTGGDDLRADSSATAYVIVVDGNRTREYSTQLKSETDSSWGNDSSHGPIVWNMAPGVTSDNLSRLGIRLHAHEDATETPDNWDITSVLVTYPGDGGGQVTLVDLSGGPLVRLTGSEPFWETDVN